MVPRGAGMGSARYRYSFAFSSSSSPRSTCRRTSADERKRIAPMTMTRAARLRRTRCARGVESLPVRCICLSCPVGYVAVPYPDQRRVLPAGAGQTARGLLLRKRYAALGTDELPAATTQLNDLRVARAERLVS